MQIKTAMCLCASAVTLALVTGCEVTATPGGVVATVPAPVVEVGVPPAYVWDGYEYVGEYNGQFLYLNGGVWVGADPVILGRFHGWERGHPDWRRSAIRYDRAHPPGGRRPEARREERR